MKKFLILSLLAIIIFSGCVGQKTVKEKDTISIDYTGSLPDGKVFDTSIESVAKENNLFMTGREYKPLEFTVGKGEVIKGFDEGVVGMKVGERKTLTIPPEKAYGLVNPSLIQTYPVIQDVPARFPKVIEVPIGQFEATFGSGKVAGDNVTIPGTDINMSVLNVSKNVSLSYNFRVGDRIPTNAPWNESVVKIDEKNITVEYGVEPNETVQFQSVLWNTTVINVSSDKITLRHNSIPDAVVPTMFGMMRVSFNETSIKMDSNHELAGKTLIFNVTLRSINRK